MQVQINQLTISNFKGIESLEIDFGQKTNIYGENASGKTSVADAFFWLLFGKDSHGSTDFNVKPLDSKGRPIHKKDVSVQATLDIDGHHMTLRRVMKEKWVKRRGEKQASFTGHTTEFFWDDVPLKKSEFEQKVSSVVDESMFRLLTNVRHFNGLHWEQRRQILFDMAGDVTYKEIATSREDFQALLDRITHKSLEEYRKEVASKKRKIKDELEEIPTRIDEARKSMPDPVDDKAVNAEIQAIDKEIAEVDDQISDAVKANETANKEIIEKQNRVRELQGQLNQAKADAENKANQGIREYEEKKRYLQHQLQSESDQHTHLVRRRDDISNNIKATEKEMIELRQKWNAFNAEEFQPNEDELRCRACGQDLPEEQRGKTEEQQRNEFNDRKAKRLADITSSGKEKQTQKQSLEADLQKVNEDIAEGEKAIKEHQSSIDSLEKPDSGQIGEDDRKGMEDLQRQVDEIQEELEQPQDAADTNNLKQKRTELQSKRDDLRAHLAVTDQIKRIELRINELEEQERTLSQALADLEADEQIIDDMVKARIEAIEERINGLFERVRFRMFEKQINEGEKETCVTLIDGVPYQDANNAGQINAGIDIINALSRHYDITAPMFVDNAEAVVNLAETEAQIIALYVSEAHKTLYVEPIDFELVEAV